ncbi:MAG: FecR domain-containing protein, partial [Elusimicrobia bacterium]|nr:FecR domain-containing protein [Elusimicrobiota bacterium]
AASAPGAGRRALASGSDVYHDDDVTTDGTGRLQVLLLDQTVFTLGPKSEVTLDDFVYDPFTDKGSVETTIKKGVFRFVTGKVGRRDPRTMNVRVPSGTIGIRGTIAGGRIDDDGSALIALLGPGADNNADERPGGLTITSPGGSVDLDDPGTATLLRPGQPPSPPFVLSPAQLQSLQTYAPPPAAPAGPGPAPLNPSGAAGQTTAAGGTSVVLQVGTDKDQRQLDSASSFAAQDSAQAIRDGLATWDDVRTIPSGQAYYDGSGSWDLTTCDGGSCANNSAGSMSFALNIDFGARTVGGNGSSAWGSDSDTNASGGSVSPSVTIPTTDFSSLSGNARLNVISGSAGLT